MGRIMSESQVKTEKVRRKRLKFYDTENRKDMRYRGPFSYRVFKILGWLCLAASQVLVIYNTWMRINPEFQQYMVEEMSGQLLILTGIAGMALPFFLISNISRILNASESYHKQILKFGGLAGIVIALYLLIYYRYLIGVSDILLQGIDLKTDSVRTLFSSLFSKGFIAFNAFIDLFLFSVLAFFVLYRPKRFFAGKKRIIFRLFALLPILYEVASNILKILAAQHIVILPAFVFPFLTVKSPMAFLVFLGMTFYLKIREIRFLRHGHTYEEYLDFLKTNRNSFHFSRFTAIILALAGLMDLLVLLGMFFMNAYSMMNGGGMELRNFADLLTTIGCGQSIMFLVFWPLVLLFSYTREHASSTVDTLIPFVGIALIVIVYLEGAYQFILSLHEFVKGMVMGWLSKLGG